MLRKDEKASSKEDRRTSVPEKENCTWCEWACHTDWESETVT